MNKRLLLKPRLPEDDIDVPGVGTVRVRALSRADVLEIRDSEGAEFERKALSLALVNPKLTEDEVGQWQAAAVGGELDFVMSKVSEMSAFNKDAAKDAYKEFESDADAEFRDVPGSEAQQDG